MATYNFCFLFAKQTNPNKSKKEVNGTVILPPFSIPCFTNKLDLFKATCFIILEINNKKLPSNLETVESVELVVLGVISGDSERNGIRSGRQLRLKPEDLHPRHRPHVDGVLNHSRNVLPTRLSNFFFFVVDPRAK
jgi:hypothetical protein